MPELPEVETVVRQLRSKIKGKTVTKVEVFDAKVVSPLILSKLPFTIKDVCRRGKFILIPLTNGDFLYIHLRMTGHFYHVMNLTEQESYKRFCSALFYLDDGSYFSYNSIRRFGHVWYLSKEQLEKELANLGPEPLEMTSQEFVKQIQKYPRANIKAKLLDQAFIAGVGNIYAQEALYCAGVHPLKRVGEIPRGKLQDVHTHLLRILQLSIDNNGTTVYNYANIDGKGDFQHLLTVYTKQVCPKGHEIEKVKIAGRGTYYCSRCQK